MLQYGTIWDSGCEVKYSWFEKMKWFWFVSEKNEAFFIILKIYIIHNTKI